MSHWGPNIMIADAIITAKKFDARKQETPNSGNHATASTYIHIRVLPLGKHPNGIFTYVLYTYRTCKKSKTSLACITARINITSS